MTHPREKHILLVEDDSSVLDLLKFAFEREGFRIDTAMDGRKALSITRVNLPDLIILDMMIPQKSGFEVIKALQSTEHRDIPIIVITGRFDENAVRDMVQYETNVKEYLTKPLKINELVQKVHEILKTGGDGGAGDKGPEETPGSEGSGDGQEREKNVWDMDI